MKLHTILVTGTVLALVGVITASLTADPVLGQIGNVTNNTFSDLMAKNCNNAYEPMPPYGPAEYHGDVIGNDNRPSFLVLSYERGGGIGGPASSFERTSFDSLTNQIVSVSALDLPKIKSVSEAEQNCLKTTVRNSGFFGAKNDYPPTDGADYFSYKLQVIMDNKTHSVSWTDVSDGVPLGIIKIVDQIDNLASK